MNAPNKVYNAIDKILWKDWDPIGVNDIGGCEDEYRSYVPEIYRLKLSNASLETMAERLFEIAEKEMDITLMMEFCRKVAGKILRL